MYAIHTKDVVIKKSADEVFTFEAKGQADFDKFYKERIIDCEVPILTPILKNNFLFYKAQKKNIDKKFQGKRNETRRITICETLYSFTKQGWKHENHSYLRPSMKSDLLQCFKKYYNSHECVPEFQSIILDGPVIVHFLDPKGWCLNLFYLNSVSSVIYNYII